MRPIFALFFLIISLTSKASTLPVIALQIGHETIQTEVASTPASQQLGLMFRKSMPNDAGMLFVFDQKAGHCFWMRNTELPLAIAFIDDDGKIVNIDEMKPQTDDNHCPSRAVRYALEMNTGWFSQHQIAAGQVVAGLPKP
jgi:uncharacterized membrane protein (UPF0127 family)